MTGFSPDTLGHIRLTTNACAVGNLRKAARVVTQLYDEALQPAGLKATQFNLLSTIALYEPAIINELADKLIMNRTTLARDLKPLEREGLVLVVVGENDQRTRQVTLTPKGRELLLKAAPLRQEIQNQVEERLGKDHFQTLLTLLGETFSLARSN